MILEALALAVSPPAETPTLFMGRLYATYREPGFSPLKHPELVFDRKLAAAIEEDRQLSQGEVGYLDGDPVCQCQDAAGLRTEFTSVSQPRPNKAKVSVSISLQGYEPRRAVFSLVRTGAGWRIADVVGMDGKSLLAGLKRANRERR